MTTTAKNTLSIVFPAPQENGLTPFHGTKVIDSLGNEASFEEITLTAKQGQPWQAAFKGLSQIIGAVTVDSPPCPAIGDYWEGQGGYYAGIMRDGDRQWHVIMPTTELSKAEGEWGIEGELIPGEFSRRDGLHNTQLILAGEPQNKIANHITALKIAGHRDFYWASEFENNLLLINLPEHLSPEPHWSSTQYSARSAWDLYFEDGGQTILSKDLSLAARAVRRLPI